MDLLLRQVRKAQRRLALQRFVEILPACLFVAFSVAAIAIAVERYWDLAADDVGWMMVWLGGAVAAALAAAALWCFGIRSQDQLGAAIELDRRFGLKERVSSTLAMGPEDLDTPAGHALVEDAVRRLDRIDVDDRFALKVSRRALLPLAPAAIALAIGMLIDDRGQTRASEASTAAEQRQVKTVTQNLQKKLVSREQKKKVEALKEGDGLFKRLEEETKKLSEGNVDRRKALVTLNELSKDLEKRREKLAGNKSIQDQLKQLKDFKRGPGDKFGDALKEGDLGKAKQELDDLQKQLDNDKLGAEAQRQLAEQLDQMRRKLEKAADEHRQAKQTLAREIERQRGAGQNAAADKLQKQLDDLEKKNDQMSKMQSLAKKLGNASDKLKNGKSKEAKDELAKASENLDEMRDSLEEMEMLDEAIAQISEAKGSMSCPKCKGDGCEACQGAGKKGGKGKGKGGDGLGEGTGGHGDRPEKRAPYKTYDSKVAQKVGRGAAVVTDFVEGPNRKGEVQDQIQAEFEAAKREAADPLTDQQLPRQQREHAKKYFDALRQGRSPG